MCPSCHQKHELLWADWAGEELLEDVPHRQVVFTIPKRLLLDKDLISVAVIDNLLSWRHRGFSAHGAVCVQDREGVPFALDAT